MRIGRTQPEEIGMFIGYLKALHIEKEHHSNCN